MKGKTENLFNQLLDLLENFKKRIEEEDVRLKVLALLPAHHALLKLGKSLMPDGLKISARDRIIAYFRKYPRTVISGGELMLISGISEWARRVRELLVQFGWTIVSGLTANEMGEEGEFPPGELSVERLGPDDYVLLNDKQDKEAAYRWNVANEIRKSRVGMKEKILLFLRKNTGKLVTGEEMRYVAKGSEWARRVRELRTEEGRPISTKTSVRPDLEVGVYLLEQDRQTPKHDRVIPDPVRREVLRRDGYKCRKCGWNQDLWDRSDPRHLEIHHVEQYADGGTSTADNLITYCRRFSDINSYIPYYFFHTDPLFDKLGIGRLHSARAASHTPTRGSAASTALLTLVFDGRLKLISVSRSTPHCPRQPATGSLVPSNQE